MESDLWLFLLSGKTGWAWEQNNSLGLQSFSCLETFFTRENKDPERLSEFLWDVSPSSRSGAVSFLLGPKCVDISDINEIVERGHSIGFLRNPFLLCSMTCFSKAYWSPLPFICKSKMTRNIINSPTSSIVLHIFVQALIVVPIVENRIVLLATHIQKERQRTQQVTVLKFDLMVPKEKRRKAKNTNWPLSDFELVTNLNYRMLWDKTFGFFLSTFRNSEHQPAEVLSTGP